MIPDSRLLPSSLLVVDDDDDKVDDVEGNLFLLPTTRPPTNLPTAGPRAAAPPRL